jgi:hypothetical protein
MKYAMFALALYSLSITGWYQYDAEQNKIIVATLERIIMQQEKLMLEKEGALEKCKADLLAKKSYTYDQWVTTKPCPPGRRGPLCHMDPTDYE